jgi:hypothetical protein
MPEKNLDTADHVDDRQEPKGYFVYRRGDDGNPEAGEYVSKGYWERNKATVSREWVKVDQPQAIAEPVEDPEVLAILHAIKSAKSAEDYDVAEFILDANEALSRVYKNIMRAKER